MSKQIIKSGHYFSRMSTPYTGKESFGRTKSMKSETVMNKNFSKRVPYRQMVADDGFVKIKKYELTIISHNFESCFV